MKQLFYLSLIAVGILSSFQEIKPVNWQKVGKVVMHGSLTAASAAATTAFSILLDNAEPSGPVIIIAKFNAVPLLICGSILTLHCAKNLYNSIKDK